MAPQPDWEPMDMNIETRIPFKVKGRKTVSVLQAIDQSGQPVPRKILLADVNRRDIICDSIGIPRIEDLSLLGWGDPLEDQEVISCPQPRWCSNVDDDGDVMVDYEADVEPEDDIEVCELSMSGSIGSSLSYIPDCSMPEDSSYPASIEQVCKWCNVKWSCNKQPPELHELCKMCERSQTHSRSTSMSDRAGSSNMSEQADSSSVTAADHFGGLDNVELEQLFVAHLIPGDTDNSVIVESDEEYDVDDIVIGQQVQKRPRGETATKVIEKKEMKNPGAKDNPNEGCSLDPILTAKEAGLQECRKIAGRRTKPIYKPIKKKRVKSCLKGTADVTVNWRSLTSRAKYYNRQHRKIVFTDELVSATFRYEPFDWRWSVTPENPGVGEEEWEDPFGLDVDDESQFSDDEISGCWYRSVVSLSDIERDREDLNTFVPYAGHPSSEQGYCPIFYEREACVKPESAVAKYPPAHVAWITTNMGQGPIEPLYPEETYDEGDPEYVADSGDETEYGDPNEVSSVQPRMTQPRGTTAAVSVSQETSSTSMLSSSSVGTSVPTERQQRDILNEASRELDQADRRLNLLEKIKKTVVSFTRQGWRNKELDQTVEERIALLCSEMWAYCDHVLDEVDAVNWAEGFQITKELVDKDEADYAACDYDFEKFIRSRLAAVATARMTLESVDLWVHDDNPDKDMLNELADPDGGMDLCLPDNYEGNSQSGVPPLASSYLKASSAVDKMIIKNFHSKGLAVIFNLDTAMSKLKNFSSAVARWVKKAWKACGRNIHDASAKQKGQLFVLNNAYSKLRCKEVYGTIYNPTVQTVVQMIWEFWETEKAKNPNVKWADLCLWKMDLAGAFTLLSFKADMVRHVGLTLANGLIVFFLCGVFGWTGTPGCFQVVNRALMWEAAKFLKGLAQMFCDDVMGVCWKKDVQENQDRMFCLIEGLLGEGAVAKDKSIYGRAIEILGYLVDLDAMAVSISKTNLYKALNGFMELDEHGLVTFKQMESLASLGSRYSLICVHLSPLVRVLYREIKGRRRDRAWKLKPRVKVAIWFFRAMLIMTHVCESEFCRPLWSLRKLHAWLWVLEFDSCLQGIGCIWYLVQPSGHEIAVGAASWDISPMGFGTEAKYQNTAEFMGAICALVGIIRYGEGSSPFLLRGDSKSALSWAEKKRYRGDLTVPAGFLFNYIWISYQVMLCKIQHLPAEFNKACDDLSRDFLANVAAFRKQGLKDRKLPKGERRYAVDMSKVGDRSDCMEWEIFMAICDPKQEWESEEDFAIFWSRMVGWCTRVMGLPPAPWSPER